MNKIVVAIDSFKGSLSSREADEAAEQGIKTIFPQCEVLHFPVADGGEGILEILTDAFHGHTVPLVAHNPYAKNNYTIRYLGRRPHGIGRNGKDQRPATVTSLPAESHAHDLLWSGRNHCRSPEQRMPALYYRNRRKCHERCRFRHVTSFRIPLFRSRQ